MKSYISGVLLALMMSTLVHASPLERDLKLTYQNIKNLKALSEEFKTLTPILQKLENESKLSHTETFKVKRLWGRMFDMRVTLNALYHTYADYGPRKTSDELKASLIKLTSTLTLVNTGVQISKLLWKMPKSHKMLNELHKTYPIGSLVSLENQIFKMYYILPMGEKLPSFFPEVDIEEQVKEFHQFGFATFTSKVENELNKIQKQESLSFKSIGQPFLKDKNNKWTIRRRYNRFMFKQLFTDIVTRVSTWLGDTKIKRRNKDYYNGKTYITLEQAKDFEQKLEPGDIMISRTNWFLSNAFLPGFWPHSFIYIGNLKKLYQLDSSPEINYHYKGKCKSQGLECDSFIGFLEKSKNTKVAFKHYLTEAKDGHEKVLIEATSDGVHFSSIRHTFLNDFLAAMRPKISYLEKAKAIEESMTFYGLPYDFDFDFDTHSSLVCSEVVAKSFLNKVSFDYNRKGGVYVEEYLNRYSLPVIGILKKMVDENVNYLRPSELEFVGFLKGEPKKKKASLASEKEFYESVDWPKWSFMQ